MLTVLTSDPGDERARHDTPSERDGTDECTAPLRLGRPAWTRFASPSTSARCYGHRTGVGAAVAELVAALDRPRRRRAACRTCSASGRRPSRPPGASRCRPPSPTGCGRALDRPRVDHWLGAAEVVHGTNYVVPPSRRPALVSVYDCWFLAHPERGLAGRPPGR